MKLFSRLYVLVMQWARHKHAPWYLSITAFIESVFWPIPVDVMLAPMALAKPHKAWHYATLATVFSVLGALFGYALGYALWDPVVLPLVESVGYQGKIEIARHWFEQWGDLGHFHCQLHPDPLQGVYRDGRVVANGSVAFHHHLPHRSWHALFPGCWPDALGGARRWNAN